MRSRKLGIFAFLILMMFSFGYLFSKTTYLSNGHIFIRLPGNKPIFHVGFVDSDTFFSIKFSKIVEFIDNNNDSYLSKEDDKICAYSLLAMKWCIYVSNDSDMIMAHLHGSSNKASFNVSITLIMKQSKDNNESSISVSFEISNYAFSSNRSVILVIFRVSGGRNLKIYLNSSNIATVLQEDSRDALIIKTDKNKLGSYNQSEIGVINSGTNDTVPIDMVIDLIRRISYYVESITLEEVLLGFIIAIPICAVIFVSANKRINKLLDHYMKKHREISEY